MADKLQIKLQVQGKGLEVRRGEDDVSRIVSGPVIIASPAFQNGQVVTPEELVGVVHFDGAFMTGPEVELFAYRFMTKRPGMDLEHDGAPRRAWPVESFLTRQADGDITEGSHMVSALSLDTEVNAAIDAGELRAWSAQLMVRAAPVVVSMATKDGEVPLLLMEFSDGDPQFLSFVKFPAIGANWVGVKRSLSLAAAPADFVEDVARARIFEWASYKGAVNVGLAAKFFPDFARSGFDHPVGDVVDGNPTIYFEAVRDVCALAQDGSDVARVMRVMRSDVEGGVAKWSQFVEGNLGIPTTANADSPAPVEETRAEPEAEPVEEQRTEPADPVAEEKRSEPDLPAADPGSSEEVRTDVADGGTEDVELQAPTFDDILAATMPGDVFWSRCWAAKWALTDAFWFTLNDADMTTAEKQAAMKAAVVSFAAVVDTTIDELFSTSSNLSAEKKAADLGMGEAVRKLVSLAGAVLSKTNLADIELAAEKLSAVLERAKAAEADGEEADLAAHEDDDEKDLAAAEPVAETVQRTPAPALDVVALAKLVADAVATAVEPLRSEIATVKQAVDDAKAEVAAVRSAAPAPASPSGADEAAVATELTAAAGSGEKKRANWGGIVAGTQK